MYTMILTLRKWFLLIILGLMFFFFFYFGLNKYLTLESLKTYEATVQQWTNQHYVAAICIYILIFILMIATTIPGATILTLIAGFLFGASGVIYAMLGIALGGTVLFYAVRTAIGERIAHKSSGWIKTVEHGFQQHAFHYILMLRLVPIFPCWISNIAAGALNVPYKTFISATLIGVAPATIIYVFIGRGLDQVLSAHQTPDLSIILTPSILLPLVGLAFLSLIPVFYKRTKRQDVLPKESNATKYESKD